MPAFLRGRISPAEAHAIVRARMASRERNLLDTLAHGVWGNARSPYRALLEAAGCERGEVERLVLQEGVEGALTKLRAAGVYVTFEEFKGLRPIERNGVSIRPRAEDYDNPSLRRYYRVATGGSTGTPRRFASIASSMPVFLPRNRTSLRIRSIFSRSSAATASWKSSWVATTS